MLCYTHRAQLMRPIQLCPALYFICDTRRRNLSQMIPFLCILFLVKCIFILSYRENIVLFVAEA